MLKTILSGETCAVCRNCCVFSPQSAWELPLFSAAAIDKLRDRPEFAVTQERDCFRVTLPYDGSGDAQPCPFLNPETGCTLPPEEKPFACSVWPVRVMRDAEGQVRLALYQGCPGVSADAHEALDRLLDSGLRDRIFAEAEQNPSLILPYHPNYVFL